MSVETSLIVQAKSNLYILKLFQITGRTPVGALEGRQSHARPIRCQGQQGTHWSAGHGVWYQRIGLVPDNRIRRLGQFGKCISLLAGNLLALEIDQIEPRFQQ